MSERIDALVSEPISVQQTKFDGGMVITSNELFLAPNQYGAAFNLRNRKGPLSCIYSPEVDAYAPTGENQNIYAFKNAMFLFQEGKAYRKLNGETAWTRLYDLDMSASADAIYMEAVPASTFNFRRQLASADNIYSTPAQLATLISNVALDGTLAGIIVQDGVSRPKIIEPDLTVRFAQDYADWEVTSPEYVPVGLMTLWHKASAKLFTVSPDKKKIYHSVSGRALDFVVNITYPAGEKNGDADTVFWAVSDEDITALQEIEGKKLVVTTTNNIYILSLDYDNTRFGEPSYRIERTINTGNLNQFSFCEGRNDYYFLDIEGPKRLSEVATDKNEARNSPFVLNIREAFGTALSQDSGFGCAVQFDDYILLQIVTIYGNVIGVYDTLNDTWVCFDSVGHTIKQFTKLRDESFPELWAVTTNNQVVRLYAARVVNGAWLYEDEYPMEWETGSPLMAQLNCRHVSSEDKFELKLQNIQATLDKVNENGDFTVYSIVDNVQQQGFTAPLDPVFGGWYYSDEYGMEWSLKGTVKNLIAPFSELVQRGYKLGALLNWNSGELVRYGIEASVQTDYVSGSQRCIAVSPLEVVCEEVVVEDTFTPVGPGVIVPPPVEVHDELTLVSTTNLSGATSSAGQSANISFPNNTDRCLVVSVFVINAVSATPTLTVLFNGVAMQLKHSVAYDGTNSKLYLYYLQNPPVGSSVFAISFPSPSGAIAYATIHAFYGVDQLDPLETPTIESVFGTVILHNEVCLHSRSYLIGVAGQYGGVVGVPTGPKVKAPAVSNATYSTANGTYGGSNGKSPLYTVGQNMEYQIENQYLGTGALVSRFAYLMTTQVRAAI